MQEENMQDAKTTDAEANQAAEKVAAGKGKTSGSKKPA